MVVVEEEMVMVVVVLGVVLVRKEKDSVSSILLVLARDMVSALVQEGLALVLQSLIVLK